MARSRIGPREPVERPADLHASIPFPPMEAELVRELPEGDDWQYEPKWDGFRGLLENGTGELRLWSRNARPLLRYFPELRPLEKLLPPRSALDGEIVIERDGVLDFDAMQMRLHPAESRINRLSAEIPARSSPSTSSSGRASRCGTSRSRSADAPRAQREALRALPADARSRRGLDWLDRFEAIGLDGVIAKRRDLPVPPRIARRVVKVKPEKTADCVVVGVRWKSKPDRIATLLLGLYRDDGELDYVGRPRSRPRRHDEIAARVLPLLESAPERRSPSRTAGAAASSRSRPCGPSSSSRCATTRCSRTASATARSSSASATTRTPRSARGASSGRRLRAKDSVASLLG